MAERAIVDPGLGEFAGRTYVPAVIHGGRLLCTSGLNAIGSDGTVAHPGDIAGQARVIYGKLARILDAAGARPADVVKTTDFIVTRVGYRATADVRRAFFGDDLPASTGVVVSELLGAGVLIEIEALAVLG